jgi:hypothetical protein
MSPRLRAGALLVSIQHLHLSKHNSATFDTQPIRVSWICPSELWPCVFAHLWVRFCSLRKHALLFAVRSLVSHWCRSKICPPKVSWGGTILSQPIRPTLRHLAVSICHWLQFGNFPGFATTFGFATTLRFARHRPVPQALASVSAYAFFRVAYGDRPYPRLGGHFATIPEACPN